MTSTDKIKVIHTRVVTDQGGGPDKTIVNSPRFLRDTRYDECACYFHPPDDPGFKVIEARAAAAGCALIGIPDAHPLSLTTLRRVAAICRAQDVRIWHGHDYKSNLFGVLLRPFLKFLLVTTVHGWVKHTKRTPLYYMVDRWTLPRHDLVVVVSQDLARECIEIGVSPSRIVLIENAIDTDEFRPTKPRPRSLRDRPISIGGAGRLSEEKGFDVAIEAIRLLLDRGHRVVLRIAGEGEDRDRLQGLIAKSGLMDSVTLLGYCTDMRDFLDDLDVFCLSSLREALPNVVLEAMAMALPIVATSSGGLGDFGRHETDMLLVPPGSSTALADALERLIVDPTLRAALAAAARRRAESELSFQHRMALMKNAYDRLIKRHPDVLSR